MLREISGREISVPGNRTATFMKLEKMVGWQGLEPWTNALKGHCSTN